ncbi:MAG: thiosulfate sulfurtransferase [Polaribacter sp.]|jgi:thiosulfate sulfurtransferase
MINQVTAPQAQELIDNSGAVVIDIRDANSFEQGHIENAIRIDNDNFQAFIESADKEKPIIVCCYHGNSSQPASQTVASFGFKSYSLQGGMGAWTINMPVVI